MMMMMMRSLLFGRWLVCRFASLLRRMMTTTMMMVMVVSMTVAAGFMSGCSGVVSVRALRQVMFG